MRRLSVVLLLVTLPAFAQEKSVKPGINDPFKNPDVEKYKGTFEGESREVYVQREKLVAACGLKPGMVVADVGAGTGLHTRLFAKAVGDDGQVYAVDISAKFLEHIQKTSREAKLRNVTPVLCNEDAVDLPRGSVDVAFVCDTYHHFEFPHRTLASLHRAIKPGGKLVVVDFKRVEGVSSAWTLNHVRAGQETVEKEIAAAGFKKADEVKDLLKDNYLVVFTRVTDESKKDAPKAEPKKEKPAAVSPVVPGYGAVVEIPNAVEPPQKDSKVVFDVTAVKDPAKPPAGLERVATLLNLAGAFGPSVNTKVTVVLHGDATAVALDDAAYTAATGQTHPAADLLTKLTKAGVEVQVCGQSLARKGLPVGGVRKDVRVAASAVSAVINWQARGYAYIPAH
jgi:ubiquinone/menaquinone biosynthesis C-methylase UbiE/intracellular sulfur oxidation DsrE/DsrF family protein